MVMAATTVTKGIVATLATPRRATLADTRRGRIQAPPRIVLYGVEGVGKSTFAAHAHAPFFIGAEDGTATLDVERVEPVDWENIFCLLDELTLAEHGYRTLVLDTLDWAEPLCWAHVCQSANKKSIEDFDFGKGYVAALSEWRRFLARLDKLRAAKSMTIILIAHSRIAMFRNPEGDDFDRYSLKLHDKSAGLIKEWSDAVLFATYETFTHENKKRVRGVSTGARIIKTVRHAAYDAKNRYNLPEELPLSWAEFETGLHSPQSPAKLSDGIAELLSQLSAEDRAKAEAAQLRAENDPTKLAMLADWCRGKIAIEGTKETNQ